MRLFVAIPLPEAIRDDLARLCRGVPGARWTPAENMHLTLRFLGEVDPPMRTDIISELGRLEAAPFEMTLKGVGSFGKGRFQRVLWAGIEETPALFALQKKVETALTRVGFDREKRKFHPHLTLARLKEAPKERVIRFLADHALYASAGIPVTRFTLYSSHLSQAGAIHSVEAEFPLEGD